MCLLTYQKEPIILGEDKTVYKILGGRTSPYANFEYKFDKLYSTEIKKTSDPTPYDKEQRLFYVDRNSYRRTKLKDGVVSIGEGFHSFTNIEYAKTIIRRYDICYMSIHECMIPAGSEYYEDETYLCVSNKIIIKNKI